tara:strand:- start:1164 stop:2045 length:882 start_codon:yes stop_codon:yes gene_type:complete
MSKKNKKIAICLFGQLRYWELVSKWFELIPKKFDNVDFTFLLSTWDDDKIEQDVPNWVKSQSTKKLIDLNDYKFLDKFERIKPLTDEFIQSFSKDEKEKNQWINSIVEGKMHFYNSARYCYSVHKITELRHKFEYKNNIIFDGVLYVRCDMLIEDCLMQKIIQILYNETQECVSERLVYTLTGTTVSRFEDGGKIYDSLFTDDTLFFGHSTVLDKLGKLWELCWETNKINTKQFHKMNATLFHYYGIINRPFFWTTYSSDEPGQVRKFVRDIKPDETQTVITPEELKKRFDIL